MSTSLPPESSATPAAGPQPAPLERELVLLTLWVTHGNWRALTELRQRTPSLASLRGREALLQLHLFCGFPRIVEAFGVLAEAGGLGAPEAWEHPGQADQPEAGRALFERIYADQTERVADLLGSYHPDFQGWILGHAYGRVLSRPGLSPRERELLACVALAATDQHRQLASHVRGALRCGATREDLLELLDALGEHLDAESFERAETVVRRFSLSDHGN